MEKLAKGKGKEAGHRISYITFEQFHVGINDSWFMWALWMNDHINKSIGYTGMSVFYMFIANFVITDQEWDEMRMRKLAG